jgi:hypothetical protein
VTDTEIDRCWRAAHDLQTFHLGEAAERAGVDEGRCAKYLEAFVELGLLSRISDLGHSAGPHDQAATYAVPLRSKDRHRLRLRRPARGAVVTETDLNRCRRAAEAHQIFAPIAVAEAVAVDPTFWSDHLDNFARLVELDLLARSGDLYRRQGNARRRLKLMVATCLWDEAQGIVGEITVNALER